MGLHTKRYMATNTRYLKRPFLHQLVIFKDSVTSFMLSTGFLMQGQIFADSHRRCGMREGGGYGRLWRKKGIGRTLLSCKNSSWHKSWQKHRPFHQCTYQLSSRHVSSQVSLRAPMLTKQTNTIKCPSSVRFFNFPSDFYTDLKAKYISGTIQTRKQ